MRIRTRRMVTAVGAGAVMGVIVAGLVLLGWTPGLLDDPAYDGLMRWTADPKEASDEIVVVLLDDPSVEWVERDFAVTWPWPRELYGMVAEILVGWGAEVVAFDLTLESAGSDAGDAKAFRSSIRETGAIVLGAASEGMISAEPPREAVAARLESFPDRGQALEAASTVAWLGYPVYLLEGEGKHTVYAGGFESEEVAIRSLSRDGNELQDLLPPVELSHDELLDMGRRMARYAEVIPSVLGALPEEAESVDAATLAREWFVLGDAPAEDALPWPQRETQAVVFPNAAFLSPKLAGLGVTGQVQERDGVVRRFAPVWSFDGHIYPSFPLAIALAGRAGGREVTFQRGQVEVANLAIPMDSQGTARARFHGPKPHREVPAWRVLLGGRRQLDGRSPEIDVRQFEGKRVLVIPAATGMMDSKPSPVDPQALGGQINAALVDSLLTGRWLRVAPSWLQAILALLMALLAGLVVGLLKRKTQTSAEGVFHSGLRLALSGLQGLVAVVAMAAPLALVAWLGFTRLDLWTTVEMPLVAGLGAAVLSLWALERLESRQRDLMHNALGIYTSDMIARVVASGGVEALEPRRDDVTIYFSDIAGFTSFSEAMEPELLGELLNEYLTEMTQVVLDHGGMIDKYIGDAIMAFWGWRETQPDHARLGVRCALEMRQRLEEIRPRFEKDYGVTLIARAGLNTGDAFAGNFGSEQKMEVTLIGDVVNLAARLESANKAYGTTLMIGEATWEQLEGEFEVRELDLLRVKGKDKPVRIFEPLSEAGGMDETMAAWVSRYQDGIRLYRERQFQEALEAFEAVLASRPGDGPAMLYIERCRAFLESPPPEDWDGVFVMTSK